MCSDNIRGEGDKGLGHVGFEIFHYFPFYGEGEHSRCDPFCSALYKIDKNMQELLQMAILVAFLQLSSKGDCVEFASVERSVIVGSPTDRLETALAVEVLGGVVCTHFQKDTFRPGFACAH